MVKEFISQLPPDKLSPFAKHPYQVREDATPSLSQALRMKQLSREAKLTPEVLYAILTEEKPNQKEQIRIKTESLRKYFPRNYSAQQMEREIIKLLEARYRAKNRGER